MIGAAGVGRAWTQLEQAWRFQELVGGHYLEDCAEELRRELRMRDYTVVEIDRSEATTNLLYFLASRGVRSDVIGPGGRLAARLSLMRKSAAASERQRVSL